MRWVACLWSAGGGQLAPIAVVHQVGQQPNGALTALAPPCKLLCGSPAPLLFLPALPGRWDCLLPHHISPLQALQLKRHGWGVWRGASLPAATPQHSRDDWTPWESRPARKERCAAACSGGGGGQGRLPRLQGAARGPSWPRSGREQGWEGAERRATNVTHATPTAGRTPAARQLPPPRAAALGCLSTADAACSTCGCGRRRAAAALRAVCPVPAPSPCSNRAAKVPPPTHGHCSQTRPMCTLSAQPKAASIALKPLTTAAALPRLPRCRRPLDG